MDELKLTKPPKYFINVSLILERISSALLIEYCYDITYVEELLDKYIGVLAKKDQKLVYDDLELLSGYSWSDFEGMYSIYHCFGHNRISKSYDFDLYPNIMYLHSYDDNDDIVLSDNIEDLKKIFYNYLYNRICMLFEYFKNKDSVKTEIGSGIDKGLKTLLHSDAKVRGE